MTRVFASAAGLRRLEALRNGLYLRRLASLAMSCAIRGTSFDVFRIEENRP